MATYSILILILVAFGGNLSQDYLAVFTDVEDTLESQRQCVKNSRDFSSRHTNERKDCICDSHHSTAMSVDGGHFGCFSATEVGCNYNLAESDQAYLVDMTKPYREEVVKVTPKVQASSIKQVLVWNLKDPMSELGSWFDITEEGMTIFSIDNNSRLMISKNRAWWNGHVVRIHLENQDYQSNDQDYQSNNHDYESNNHDYQSKNRDYQWTNSSCIVVKFKGYSDPYPFDLPRWRKRILKPSKVTTPSPEQPTTALITTTPPKPITTTPPKPSHVAVITTTTITTNITTIRDNEIRTTITKTITTATMKPNEQPKITTDSTTTNTTKVV